MIQIQPNPSQRLVRKGALIEESYRLLKSWDESIGLRQNLERIGPSFSATQAWGREVTVTLGVRFRDLPSDHPLILLARRSLPLDEWKWCLLEWIGSRELLFGRFIEDRLYPESRTGRLSLNAQDLREYVTSLWREIHPDSRPLSDYGTTRTARDLLRMATEFGLLEPDGVRRRVKTVILPDRVFLYIAHRALETTGAGSKVLLCPVWRLFLLSPEEVRRELLRLHQFKRLRYEEAGSVVELQLPCASSREYAERMTS